MPRFALPSCPRCAGSGEIEEWFECATFASVSWSHCPCIFREEPEEDWTKP